MEWEHGCASTAFAHQLPDIDAGETAEWLDAFDDVVETTGVTGPASS